MGERKSRRQRFFAEHPFCCFCGGQAPATTEDHQPGRVFFKDREWPEGFSFPACDPCNAASKNSERILAVLIHGHGSDENRSAYQANLESVRREFPDEIGRMIPTRSEIRNVFKSKGLQRPFGIPLSDIPLVKFGGEFWEKHLKMLGRKLLLALHYQCFGKPLSHKGGMWCYLHTNVNFAAGEFPEELIELTANVALPMRSRRYLHNQFSVRWGYATDSRSAVFVAQLQKLLVVSGFTSEEPDQFGSDWNDDLLRPFSW